MTDRAPWISFYPDDWEAGTSWMPPLVEWTYFKICRYIWDKCEPLPKDFAPMVLGKNSDFEANVAMLVKSGHVEKKRNGDLVVKRALQESQKANRVRESKKKAAETRWNREAEKPKKSETNDAPHMHKGDFASVNQNQNQNQSIISPVIPLKSKRLIAENYEPTIKGKIEEFLNEVGDDIFQGVRQEFIDFHRGKGNKFVDHDAAFRTWIRRRKEFAAKRGTQNRPNWDWIKGDDQ